VLISVLVYISAAAYTVQNCTELEAQAMF